MIIHHVGVPFSYDFSEQFWRKLKHGKKAIVYRCGSVEYRVDGLRHREDGPALVLNDTRSRAIKGKYWFHHGKIHREDGPAFEYQDGNVSWYLEDERLPFDEWLRQLKASDEEKVFLKLKWSHP